MKTLVKLIVKRWRSLKSRVFSVQQSLIQIRFFIMIEYEHTSSGSEELTLESNMSQYTGKVCGSSTLHLGSGSDENRKPLLAHQQQWRQCVCSSVASLIRAG